MKTTIKHSGDDFFLNRLLFYLRNNLSLEVTEIIPIRKHVFKIILSSANPFILKGFSSSKRLELQQQFTQRLQKEGFHQTYSFLHYNQEQPLYFDNIYYGCIEFIQASEKEMFTFHDHENRLEGLELLQQFHVTTAKYANDFSHQLKPFRLLDKWTIRRAKFLNNLSLIHFFVQKEYLQEIINWANWSLSNLQIEGPTPNRSEVILHGDVAHHNFLRKETGELLLIDFDLISQGDVSSDYLQYANRILPFIDWSFEELFKLEPFKPYLEDKFFLSALVFPTDLFREWNRVIIDRNYNNPFKIRQLMDMTVEQFPERKIFVEKVKKRISS